MRWTNHGKEFDIEADSILRKFESVEKIAIFGAGILGKELALVLESYHIFGGYIDNDVKKQGVCIEEKQVWKLEDYIFERPKDWIVIAATPEHTKEITAQLEVKGKKRKEDFWEYENFTKRVFPILSFYNFNKLYVELAQICVTERCTLKCKKCAHACNYVPMSAKDMPFDEMKRSADCFFENIDFVKEFVLIGGEPFLHKELADIIVYIGEAYRKQILRFVITTNGTIIPNDKILDLCKRYDVTIRISDYSITLPKLKMQYKLLQKKLQGINTIIWDTDDEASWFDYGFESVGRGDDPDVLVDVFNQCRTSCREIRKDKYYYCVMARSVAENTRRDIGDGDYFDLSKEVDKKQLFEFEMGYSEKGYLDMCRFCRGREAMNYRIPAAVQETRSDNG